MKYLNDLELFILNNSKYKCEILYQQTSRKRVVGLQLSTNAK